MTDAVKGQYYRYETNPDYWGDAPNIDGIEFKIYQNDNGLVTALQNGEIDFADDVEASAVRHPRGPGQHHREVVAVLRVQLPHLQRWCSTDRRRRRSPARPATPRWRTRWCARRSTTRSTRKHWSTAHCRVDGAPGDTFIPPIYEDFHLDDRGPDHLRPRLRQPAAGRGGVHQGCRRHPHHARWVRPVGLHSSTRGRTPRPRRPRSSCCRAGSRPSGSTRRLSRYPRGASTASPVTERSTCTSGAGSSSPTRTTRRRSSPVTR